VIKKSIIALGLIGAFAAPTAADSDTKKIQARNSFKQAGKPFVIRPNHTFSIVARDPETGEFGVAVQTHWFSVGTSVAWAQPGVGAVATQSFTERSYGPLGLEMMAAGKSAKQTLRALLAADDHIDVRQVGMVDANGVTAVHTGENAIIEHCNHAGEGFTVQANLMLNSTVCKAMIKAYTETKGDLAERMMTALEAAQAEGGDIRGKQSSALIVVSGDATKERWNGTNFDLRIDDHDDPITEMRRLLTVARGYKAMQAGDDFITEGKIELAIASYTKAEELMPDNHEAIFWHAATLAGEGYVDQSLPLFAKAFKMWPDWKKLIVRLPASGLLPDDPELIKKILNAKE